MTVARLKSSKDEQLLKALELLSPSSVRTAPPGSSGNGVSAPLGRQETHLWMAMEVSHHANNRKQARRGREVF